MDLGLGGVLEGVRCKRQAVVGIRADAGERKSASRRRARGGRGKMNRIFEMRQEFAPFREVVGMTDLGKKTEGEIEIDRGDPGDVRAEDELPKALRAEALAHSAHQRLAESRALRALRDGDPVHAAAIGGVPVREMPGGGRADRAAFRILKEEHAFLEATFIDAELFTEQVVGDWEKTFRGTLDREPDGFIAGAISPDAESVAEGMTRESFDARAAHHDGIRLRRRGRVHRRNHPRTRAASQ